MRNLIVGLAAAGIAALANAPSAQSEELKPEIKAAIVFCMLQSNEPRPFKVTDSKDWNDYRFDGTEVVFFDKDAHTYFRAKCKALVTAMVSASSVKQ